MIKKLLVIIVVLCSPNAYAADNKSVAEAWANVSDVMKKDFVSSNTIGGSLYYVRDGKPYGALNLGLADLATKRAVDENTIFHWASITKTFTDIALMQLVEEGKVKLSDPIIKYLPELRKVHNPYGSMEDITLDMLVSHTSGFRNGSWPWAGGEDWMPFEPTDWEQIVAMLPYMKINFKPGSKFQYSNPALIFIGKVIEKVTGEDIEIYINKNILMPLEMRSSYFDITPRHLLKYRSNNYFVVDGLVDEQGLDFDTGITAANGGLNAPMKDMVKYLNFLLGTGDKKLYEGILKRKTLESLWQPVAPIEENESWLEQISHGFFLYDHKDSGAHYIGHTGSQAAYYSFFYLNPKTNSAVIMVTNSRPRDSERKYIYSMRKYIFDNLLYK
ncbi:MAG: beta-lactamase family protein [Alphaproteobacteria bacterium]|nr:beta-lactamase family protein [Alphaproteobacteria bacterium]HPF46046.1 serine hydrolase domain-containing protein [Emcibacteraceae bacterium]HRW30182.1 serine hydrolase domain-containing protein [Emcibacteraceae bacterium]